MDKKPIYAKFLNRNGYDSERNQAAKVFDMAKEYEIVGGQIYSSSSNFIFKGIPGSWNTVMFSVSWEQAQDLMEHCY